MPGDEIQMKNGVLHINGTAVKKEKLGTVIDVDSNGVALEMTQYQETLPNGVSYIVQEYSDDRQFDNTGLYKVPDGHYFMMGDNRDRSLDSRALSVVGYVPLENFIGKAEVRFFSIKDNISPWQNLALAGQCPVGSHVPVSLSMSKQKLAIAELEQRIGHSFKDPALLQRALTHSSAVAPTKRTQNSYQRLEFLGDRVLGLVVADRLQRDNATANEGGLSRALNAVVRKESCAEVARKLNVAPALILGQSEAKTGGAQKEAILGDVCEAIIGAPLP